MEVNNFISNDTTKEQLMELNLKLREDLSKCFENYIRVLATADKLQKVNVDLEFRVG